MARTTKTKSAKWLPILDIPEATSGRMSVRHEVFKAGQSVMLNNMRSMLFRQSKEPMNVTFDHDVRFHWLQHEEDGIWTSDLPIEQQQQFEDVKGLEGHVLVGGLGLGMIAVHLASKRNVKSVTVVEKDADVITLVEPYIQNPKITVVCSDLFDYLKQIRTLNNIRSRSFSRFNSAFYDIWRSDGESTFFKTVCPLIEQSDGVVRGEVRNWNEGVMRGQLRLSLQNRRNQEMLYSRPEFGMKRPANLPQLWEEMPAPIIQGYDPIFHNWSVPFFKWVLDDNPDPDLFEKGAIYYSTLYGCHGWLMKWDFTVAHLLK